MVTTLADNNFEKEVLKAGEPVLVDFGSSWCGPCRMMEPVVEELAAEFEGKIKVCKLNVDEGPTTARKYGVMSIPTLIIFKNGEDVERVVGVQGKQVLVEKLEGLVGNRNA